jgi:hypothetical protein
MKSLMTKLLKPKKLLVIVLLCSPALLAGSCLWDTDTAASPASCAFVYGNGLSGNDSKLHNLIYPGQVVKRNSTSENVSYVPCNSRNYIIKDGEAKDTNGTVIGDIQTPIKAYTTTGVPILIGATAYFTLNESDESMRDFYNVCFKHTCASDKDVSGSSNNSTPGWTDMLGEDFLPAMNTAGFVAASEQTDLIWQQPTPKLYSTLADDMSTAFMKAVQQTTGYNVDLFCGSGASKWMDPSDPSKKVDPGTGKFDCKPVRFVVNSVRQDTSAMNSGTQGTQVLNAQALQDAIARYGSNQAGYWRGLLDAIAACEQASHTTCVINIGNGTPAAVSVPATSGATPTPSPTAKP